jgi:hypothetical protein
LRGYNSKGKTDNLQEKIAVHEEMLCPYSLLSKKN